MNKKSVFTPSTSFVITKIPINTTKEDIELIFKIFGSIEKIEFHYLTPTFFLNKATIVFSDMDIARKVSMNFLGKKIGNSKMRLFYSILPFSLSNNYPIGEIPTKEQYDDPDCANNMYMPGYLVQDRYLISEIPEIPSKIHSIFLRFNYISEIKIGYENITTLNLKGNNLKFINESVSFPSLIHCNLSYNLLTESPCFYKLFPKIEKLDISHNQIFELGYCFSNLKFLKEIDISNNRIYNLPKLPEQLSIIKASNNFISEVVDEFSNSLRDLDFMNNKLTFLPKFSRGKIEKHFFIYNNLIKIDFSLISQIVTILNFSCNNLIDIPSEIFSLKNLQELILFNNNISIIPNEITKSRITHLNISQNPIEELPLLPLSLRILKASFCKLTDLNNSIHEQNFISTVHLNNNKLNYLPNFPAVTELLISSNELEVLPFFNSSIFTKIILDASFNNIQNIPPLSSPFILLDLSFNNLNTIPDSIFQHKSCIKLTGNNINMEINSNDLNQIESLDIFKTNIKINNLENLPKHLFEIITKYDNLPSNNFKNLKFQADDSIGYSEFIGKRPEMEDAIIIRKNFKENLHFFGIFDGHGGSNTARLAAATFPDLFYNYQEINQETINEVINNFQNKLLLSNEESGSTMQLIFIKPKSIIISQLGDSKTIIIKKNNLIKFSTIEQIPENRKELERLRNDKIKLGKMRTSGFLAMSSSLADFQVKGVNHIPETIELLIESDDKWLISACDGLWDDFKNLDVCKLIENCNNPAKIATLLRDEAYSRGSEDNISVIVIDLEKIVN